MADAFASNLEDDLEIGAAFAATIGGEPVVDMWAGHADVAKTRPWERDTIVNMWSSTKAMVTTCAHMLVDRDLLDIEEPVSRYWPEFAQAGKESMPVKYLLSHRSALTNLSGEILPIETFYDWDLMAEKLAAQAPLWLPGGESAYHNVTFRFLVGEIIRRISGKSVGTFLRDEIAEPLGADFHLGLDDEHFGRVAELLAPPPRTPRPGAPVSNPTILLSAGNRPEWRRAEIPAANGHGNARSVARIMSALACGGEVDGVRLMHEETIANAIREQVNGMDRTLREPISWGAGFMLITAEHPFGPNPRIFGHTGAGGSQAFADLDAQVSWSYAMNKMTMKGARAKRIVNALYAAL